MLLKQQFAIILGLTGHLLSADMKHFYRLVTCIVLCSLMSLNVLAVDITVGFLKYSVSGNSATVIGYVEDELPKDLVIPGTIEYNELTFNVSAIGKSAFKDCEIIETLYVPESVKSISANDANYDGAFYNCSNLRTVTMEGIETIGRKAFFRCKNIKWINFGNILKSIQAYAFQECTSLTYLVFPSTITSLFSGSWNNEPAFENCDFIQAAIYLGDKVVSTGLSNIKTYTRKDFITWATKDYTYTGKEIEPEYTNNLPFNFKPDDDIILEKNAGTYTKTGPVTFSNNDMSFTVELPYEYTINPKTVIAHVKDATREYGESNPEFGVELTGFVSGEDQSVLTNTGSFSTTANLQSVVGTYDITLSGMESQNYLFQYESGNLTVTKAPLKISVGDYTIKQGEPLPDFVATYEGFKNEETEQVLTTLPTISCDITNTDVVGEYPITISGADGNNYEIEYTNGKLIIEKNETPLGKCATPTISIENGKIKFSCEIEGVSYHYDITHSDVKSGDGNDVELTNTYTISVYATKNQYEKSDIATMEIKGSVVIGDANGDGKVTVTDAVEVMDIILNNGSAPN